MILPLLFGAIDLGLSAVEQGAKVYDRARKIWRAVSPPKDAAPAPGQLSFKDVENQREQMRAATSKGTVTGPTPSRTPDTARSRTILPPPPTPGRN